MSFDMQYDRDGKVKPAPQVERAVTQAAEQLSMYDQSAEDAARLAEKQTQSEPEVVENPTEDAVVEEPTAVAAPAESNQVKNFRAIKERAERAERERDELMRMMTQKEQPQVVEPEEDLNFTVDADALVEGKHLSKVDKKIRQLEQKLAQYEQKSTASNAETRLKAQYSDFDSVVTADNVAQLREEYPELAQSLISNPDLYTKGKAAYLMLKKFGIAQDPVMVAEKALIQKNAAKPRPLTSVSPQQGATPLSQANAFANGLTKELREQLAREVSEARRNM